MMIEKYSFGSITINGQEYTKDVIIFPDTVLSPWWREEGHSLSLKDLKEATEAKPSLLIIGTGAYGGMNIPNETLKKLEEKNIDTIFAKTGEAVKLYNEKIQATKKVIACLHLTC
ncbi:hypothetical protein JW879_07505 [candidate division WOR-3 bacterium]|nr:hypothetical protein [candidate division WOR-3 bacterium]